MYKDKKKQKEASKEAMRRMRAKVIPDPVIPQDVIPLEEKVVIPETIWRKPMLPREIREVTQADVENLPEGLKRDIVHIGGLYQDTPERLVRAVRYRLVY